MSVLYVLSTGHYMYIHFHDLVIYVRYTVIIPPPVKSVLDARLL